MALSRCNNQSKGVGVGSKDYFRVPRAVTHKGEKIEKLTEKRWKQSCQEPKSFFYVYVKVNMLLRRSSLTEIIAELLLLFLNLQK